jgi:hypothetical protein
MRSIVHEPLEEEAAFLAAAVAEGSLTARQLTALVLARLDRIGTLPSFRPASERALERAGEIDARPARTAMVLAGVPVVVAGTTSPQHLDALLRAGVIVVGHVDGGERGLASAARLVAAGGAALALLGEEFAASRLSCATHRLLPAGARHGFLARSCRDFALAVDVVRNGASDSPALCRPVTSQVGHGGRSLHVAVASDELASAIDSKSAYGMTLAATTPEDAAGLAPCDAVIAAHDIAVPYEAPARIVLPWRGTVPDAWIVARSTDVAIRIGAVLDAAALTRA